MLQLSRKPPALINLQDNSESLAAACNDWLFFSENTIKNAGMAVIKLRCVQYTDGSLQAV